MRLLKDLIHDFKPFNQKLKSKANCEAPPFPLLPPVKKIFFTGANGENEGLGQLNYRMSIARILRSKANCEAPPFPLLPPVKKIFFTGANGANGANGGNGGLEQPSYHL